MKCQDLLAVLNEYVDGAVDAGLCEEFERHMAGCHRCQVVVDTVRKTIRVYQNGREKPLPAEFHTRLHEALRARWREAHQQAKVDS